MRFNEQFPGEVIEIIEVSPRDGLQNEAVHLSTADKIDLITRLERAGAPRIEVASFVHPRCVPQMADAEAVVAGLPSGHSAPCFVGNPLTLRARRSGDGMVELWVADHRGGLAMTAEARHTKE